MGFFLIKDEVREPWATGELPQSAGSACHRTAPIDRSPVSTPTALGHHGFQSVGGHFSAFDAAVAQVEAVVDPSADREVAINTAVVEVHHLLGPNRA